MGVIGSAALETAVNMMNAGLVYLLVRTVGRRSNVVVKQSATLGQKNVMLLAYPTAKSVRRRPSAVLLTVIPRGCVANSV